MAWKCNAGILPLPRDNVELPIVELEGGGEGEGVGVMVEGGEEKEGEAVEDDEEDDEREDGEIGAIFAGTFDPIVSPFNKTAAFPPILLFLLCICPSARGGTELG